MRIICFKAPKAMKLFFKTIFRKHYIKLENS